MLYLDKTIPESSIIVSVSSIDINPANTYYLKLITYNGNDIPLIELVDNVSTSKSRYDEFVIDSILIKDIYPNDYHYQIIDGSEVVYEHGILRVMGEEYMDGNIPNLLEVLNTGNNTPNDIRFIEDY